MNLLSLHFAMKELDWWPCSEFMYKILDQCFLLVLFFWFLCSVISSGFQIIMAVYMYKRFQNACDLSALFSLYDRV